MKRFCVYIMANKKRGTLYIGVTSNLIARVYEHRSEKREGFTKRYRLHKLVYYEMHGSAKEAFHRETQLKKWNRIWKIELIENKNPNWEDLYEKGL
jgi:putative endonuclease